MAYRADRYQRGGRTTAAFLFGFIALGGCAMAPSAPPKPEPAKLKLEAARFQDLPDWSSDAVLAAQAPLIASCDRMTRDGNRDLTRFGFAGQPQDWRAGCAAIAQARTDEELRRALETHFRPWRAVTAEGETLKREGLFTGYFEPLLRGSRTRTGPYQTPLHRRPDDLVTVELGDFRESLRGQRIAGRVEAGRLRPYADRAAIAQGALANRGLEILYVDDPVDALVLQIQGSGRVRLTDGREIALGFAAQNGHAYIALGRVLIDAGILDRENATLPAIRAALAARPAEVQAWLNQNPSYVFFEERPAGSGPQGAQGVALTAERSLAVDRAHWPMGLPFFVATEVPTSAGPVLWRKLMVGQDTGGAIRGPIRGDVFFGPGEEAEWRAGHLRSLGAKWVLLPAHIDAGAGQALN